MSDTETIEEVFTERSASILAGYESCFTGYNLAVSGSGSATNFDQNGDGTIDNLDIVHCSRETANQFLSNGRMIAPDTQLSELEQTTRITVPDPGNIQTVSDNLVAEAHACVLNNLGGSAITS